MTAVETGWGADGHFGTWSSDAPNTAVRRIHPPAPETAPDDTWWWTALCAAGCTARGAARSVSGVGAWLVDVDSRDVARHCADAVRAGTGTSEQWYQALRVRRERRWCRWTGALLGAVGCAGAGWWGALQLTSGQCSALVGTAFIGAVWWCWWYGQPWVEQDGIAPRMPAPLTMPSAPDQTVPAWREPTWTELLRAARGVFHDGEPKLPTAEITARLHRGGPPWSRISPRSLSSRLIEMGLESVNTNMAGEHGVNPKGFRLADIIRALDARTAQPDHDE